jgi:PAS domain S-box-containing protein
MYENDRNLLFGVIAMQCDLIDRRRFVDACTLWASRKQTSLADVLVAQRWMTAADRQYVDDLLERRQKNQRSGLAADSSIDQSLDDDISMVGTVAMRTIREGGSESSRIVQPEHDGQAITIHDRITLNGLHSSGGIGEVWRAYDHALERKIALKRLRTDKAHSEVHRARFTREAKLTGQLDHPGIVPVYDYHAGAQGIESFYTMRFLHGRTFTDVIHDYHAERAHFEITGEFLRLLDHFTGICNTIAFAHSRNVIHRDIKGDNVIIGDFGEVIVLDWGLAKEVGVDLVHYERADQVAKDTDDAEGVHTLQGETLGTPSYMAPEQAEGRIELIDFQTDVYGLAAILYEILTGRPPFQDRNLAVLLRQVIEQPPRAPSDLLPGVPAELERICLQGLSKNMAERQSSVSALAGQVRAWVTERAEHKRAEQERERFFDLSLDFLAIVEQPDRISQSNSAWLDRLGWSGEERARRSFCEFVHIEDRDLVAGALEELWSSGSPASFEVRLLAKSGGLHWLDWHARLIPGQAAAYLVGRDVTERRSAEEECQGLLESAPDATCVVDASGTIISVNTQLERLFGYARAELVGLGVEALIPESYRQRHRHHVAHYIASPGFRPMGIGLQLLGQKKDGTIFPLEISLGPVETSQRLLISCALRDTSQRQHAERKLRQILDSIADPLVVVDREHRVDYMNRPAQELFGYSQSEVLGRPAAMLLPARFRAAHADHLERSFAQPKFRRIQADQPLVGERKGGTEFPIRLTSTPISTDDTLLLCTVILALVPAAPPNDE